MTRSIQVCMRSIWKSCSVVFSALALVAVMILCGATPAQGSPPDDVASLKAQMEIGALAARYAAGVDAIGRGNVEEGRQILRTCFTDDVVFESFLPLHDPNAPAAFSFIGLDAFADGASAGFSFWGYTATQHHVGNVQVTVQGNTATMKSYITAFHVLDWSSSGDLATGTYIDQVVHTPAGWRIAHRSLHATSFLRLLGAPVPLP
jgi:hypothetical protein